MTKTIVVCDKCSSETLNMQLDGWLQIEDLQVWAAIIPDKGTRFTLKSSEDNEDAKHFCSVQCLTTWLGKELQQLRAHKKHKK